MIFHGNRQKVLWDIVENTDTDMTVYRNLIYV